MYALIAFLFFLGIALAAYAWFTLGVILAILFPILFGSLVWFVLSDPMLDVDGDSRFIVVMFCLILLFVELAIFMGIFLKKFL